MFSLIENVSKSMKAAFEDSEATKVEKERKTKWMYDNLHEKRLSGSFATTVDTLNYDGTKPLKTPPAMQQSRVEQHRGWYIDPFF